MWEFGGICELLCKLLCKLPRVGVGAFLFPLSYTIYIICIIYVIYASAFNFTSPLGGCGAARNFFVL